MIKQLIILILAIPTGYLLAWLAKDELVIGRPYFRILIIASIVLGAGFYFFDFVAIALTCFFITIVSVIAFVKSSDKKWTTIK